MTEEPMDPIHLLCAADARYGAYAGIMISSVLRSNPGETFHIHLFSNEVRRRDLRRISALIRRANSHFNTYDVVEQMRDYANPGGYHLTRTMYARLLAPELLPPSLGRIIYLDCDMICTGRLRPLWQSGEAVPVLGAVPDRAGSGWKALLGLSADAPYFNSGMLLINLAAWRQDDLGRAIIATLAAHNGKLRLPDQDALNIRLRGSITPLPECWNLQIGADSGPLPPGRLEEAVLLHYTSIPKPWVFGFDGLGAELFRQAKRASPWRFKLPTFRLTYRLKKALDKRLARWRAGVPAAVR